MGLGYPAGWSQVSDPYATVLPWNLTLSGSLQKTKHMFDRARRVDVHTKRIKRMFDRTQVRFTTCTTGQGDTR